VTAHAVNATLQDIQSMLYEFARDISADVVLFEDHMVTQGIARRLTRQLL